MRQGDTVPKPAEHGAAATDAPPTASSAGSRPTRAQWLMVWGLSALVGALYFAHSALRFRNYESKGYDLGIFDQVLRQYSLFSAPIVPVKGVNFNLLGDHFHPLIAVFSPLYWLWDHPMMANVIMIALLLASAAPVYLFARRRLGHWPGVLVVGVLLLFWPFQAIVNWDFHEVAIAVPLVAWILYCLDTRRYWWVVALAVPLLGVREDMGATILGIALVLAIRKQWGRAALLGIIGALGFVLVYAVVVPALAAGNPNTRNYWEYSALGASAGAAGLYVITHPVQTFLHLFDHPLKGLWWLISFVPFGLLSLASPYVLIAAPIILSRMLSDRLNVWAPVYQYDSVLLPILLLAFVDTLAKLVRRTGWRRLAVIGPAIPLSISLVGTAFIPALFPLQRTVTGQNWAMPAHASALARAVDKIPSGVCVEAADNAVPHLTNRNYVGLVGKIGDDLASWAIIDTTVEELGGWDPLTPQQALERAERLGFTVVTNDDDGVWLLHRDIPVDPVCSSYLPNAQTAPRL